MIKQPEIDGLAFHPWVGEQYHSRKDWGIRLLVLGESHYGEPPPKSNLTQCLTQQNAKREWSHRFWTNIAQSVSGEHHTTLDHEWFWNSVALYNFVQDLLPAARRCPAPPQWERGRNLLPLVLERLRPEAILVLGVRLWNQLPVDALDQPPLRSHHDKYGSDRAVKRIVVPNARAALASCINHPSSGFSSKRWHPWVQALIERARSA